MHFSCFAFSARVSVHGRLAGTVRLSNRPWDRRVCTHGWTRPRYCTGDSRQPVASRSVGIPGGCNPIGIGATAQVTRRAASGAVVAAPLLRNLDGRQAIYRPSYTTAVRAGNPPNKLSLRSGRLCGCGPAGRGPHGTPHARRLRAGTQQQRRVPSGDSPGRIRPSRRMWPYRARALSVGRPRRLRLLCGPEGPPRETPPLPHYDAGRRIRA
ncbi:MAG: hypothetical protein ACI9W4_002618 [Rhodothermales bacterium]|jgi:hypothetical protein